MTTLQNEINFEYLHKQLEQVRHIYETLFGGDTFEAHFWWEKAPINTPFVCEPHKAYSPEIVSIDRYLGHQIFGDPEDKTRHRIHITIPSEHQTTQPQDETVAWEKRSWMFRAVHRYTPMLGEYLKHLVELKRRRTMLKTHKFTSLPYSNGILPPQPMQRDLKKTPAALIGFHWLAVGGAEKLAFDTVDWALEQGLRVIVLTDVKGPQPLADKLPDDDRLTLLRTDQYLPRHLASEFIAKLIARENIVITHNHHSVLLYDALPTIRITHPDVINMDSTHIIEHMDGGYPRISGVWSNFLDYHHVISADLKKFFRERFHIHSKVVQGRLLSDAQRVATPAPLSIRKDKKESRVVFVGRMMHQKRPLIAVEIFRQLARWSQKGGPCFQFDMVGEGSYRAAVHNSLKRANLTDMVTLHPAKTDVPALLKTADILILPSTNEGLALVSYEAIEQGCVPISCDVGAQSEITPEALLVPTSPPRAIRATVDIIKRLLSENGFAETMERELHDKFANLAAEPSAKDVVSEIYSKARDRAAS